MNRWWRAGGAAAVLVAIGLAFRAGGGDERPRDREPAAWKAEVRTAERRDSTADTERREREARSDAMRERISNALLEGDSVSAELAMVAWYEVDPAAVEEWVAVQEEPGALDAGVFSLAFHLGDQGRLDEGVAWAKRVHDPERQATVLRDLYALALRKREITLEDVPLAELPQWVREDLESGALGD